MQHCQHGCLGGRETPPQAPAHLSLQRLEFVHKIADWDGVRRGRGRASLPWDTGHSDATHCRRLARYFAGLVEG